MKGRGRWIVGLAVTGLVACGAASSGGSDPGADPRCEEVDAVLYSTGGVGGICIPGRDVRVEAGGNVTVTDHQGWAEHCPEPEVTEHLVEPSDAAELVALVCADYYRTYGPENEGCVGEGTIVLYDGDEPVAAAGPFDCITPTGMMEASREALSELVTTLGG